MAMALLLSELRALSCFELNLRVAKSLGLDVKTEFEDSLGFTVTFHERYPNTIWARDPKKDEPWEQRAWTHNAEDAWPLIELAWPQLMAINIEEQLTRWQAELAHTGNTFRAALIIFLAEKTHDTTDTTADH